MNYTEAELLLSDIDQTDESFRITTAPLDDALIRSIERVGILNRPLLIRKKGAFTIVCGFRRISAFEKRGNRGVVVRLLPEETQPFDCLKIAIADNLTQRTLNAIEMARAIDLLSRCVSDPDALDQAIETSLNLGRNKNLIQKLRAVHALPEWMKTAILNERLDFSVGAELVKFHQDDLRAMVGYFNTLRLSLSKQREFVTFVTEISKREKIPVHRLLEELELKSIKDDPEIDGNQKTAMIRSFLKKRRYPTLVQAETLYNQFQKELKMSPDMTLSPPKDFEGSTFSLTLRFSSLEELSDQKKALDSLIQNPVLKKLVNKAFY